MNGWVMDAFAMVMNRGHIMAPLRLAFGQHRLRVSAWECECALYTSECNLCEPWTKVVGWKTIDP